MDNCRQVFDGIKHYGNDEDVLLFTKDNIQLYQQFKMKGYQFETVIAPSAIVSEYAELGCGVQVMDGVIINTGIIVEYDCNIGSHNHIAPGVVLSGQVITSDTFILVWFSGL